MKEFKGKAYRAETGYKHEKGQTAADVVRYEQEELGNDLGITAKVLAQLQNCPASNVVWVTKSKAVARRYGGPVEYPLPAGSVVLAEDGDEGFLVLKKSGCQ